MLINIKSSCIDNVYNNTYNENTKEEVFIMPSTNINIRMDSELKKDFEAFCADMGMTMTTAINVFAKKTVREYRIPFEIGAEIPNGETKEAIVMIPVSSKSLQTSAIRLIFSARSSAEKPRLELRPVRILSPSRTLQRKPLAANACSNAEATVLLPEPESPVNQTVRPLWPINASFSARVWILLKIG